MEINYNPDVLTCLANLSNDEVFTPPNLVNNILDLLPNKIWEDETVTFLDPVSKSGVFLREITKRLDKGLENKINDKQQRINHILRNQVFGIGITELTALLSRRSVYCSKIANGKYSICDKFEDAQGNIIFNKTNHIWKNGSCIYCGASEKEYKRSEELETHAYEFIHTKKPEEVFNMRFDVIVGNPPYQLDTSGFGKQAKPIYHLFVETAKKINPKYIVMITPSRWFTGGMGLDSFRKEMLSDKRIRKIVDFSNSKDCFPGVSISGGVNYFLWDQGYNGECEVVNIHNEGSFIETRSLQEFPVFIRQNKAVNIIRKLKLFQADQSIVNFILPINVFNIPSTFRGKINKEANSIKVLHSNGKGFVKKEEIYNGLDYIDQYKVVVSRTISEHAGEPSKKGDYKLFAKTFILNPNEICTHSYLVVGSFNNNTEAINFHNYIRTKFVRFCILQVISGIDLSRERFFYVPMQDFTKTWTDEKLYKKYGLIQKEIDFIESMIRPMELDIE